MRVARVVLLCTLATPIAWSRAQGQRRSNASSEAPWPTNGWAVSTAGAQGLNPSPLLALDSSIRRGTYGYLDRLVVIRNGYVVQNERYAQDYRSISRGRTGPLGCGVDACANGAFQHEFNYYHPDWHPYYQGKDVHTLQSVTKSVASTLIGIAIERGEIAGTDVPLLSFFEDRDLSRVDDRLHDATLEDLLTMRTGIEWHETDRPIDETNTTLRLERSRDWIEFTLAQPMDARPGEKWVYNSGTSHLMSGIIRKATGRFADAYAELYLFRPLGIREYHWKKTPAGYPDTEGGLYLEAEQLAKIGYLFLHGGTWDGRRIVSQDWVRTATGRIVNRVNQAEWGYGYQWWRLDRDDVVVWAGLGFGGQFLFVIPDYQLIGVVNSWNVFGGNYSSIQTDFLTALISSIR
jgi:CubicO group peptidase (beta-lactamase class C family)